jgi:hypothetical protein
MHVVAMLVGLALQAPPVPAECATPPGVASASYWLYVESCGCASLEAPPAASEDYERFLKACAEWRQRNPALSVVVSEAPAAVSSPSTPGCGDPPSRASDFYWGYLEACGCARLEAPSRASQDYERFMKACAAWRRQTPQVQVIVATPSPRPSPSPSPSPKPAAPPRDRKE